MHSLLLWKDDKNYSGFACHLKNKQAPNLSGFIWLYRTRLKVHHAPNYGRTNSSLGHLWWVGLFVLSLCVSLLAMISEASNIFHLCIKLIKGRLLVALNDFFFFSLCWTKALSRLPCGVLGRDGYSRRGLWVFDMTGHIHLHELSKMNQLIQAFKE